MNSVNDIIFPEKEQILENKKEGKRRYITKRFTDISGINPKEKISMLKLMTAATTLSLIAVVTI